MHTQADTPRTKKKTLYWVHKKGDKKALQLERKIVFFLKQEHNTNVRNPNVQNPNKFTERHYLKIWDWFLGQPIKYKGYIISTWGIYSTIMFYVFVPYSFWTGYQHQEMMWPQIFIGSGNFTLKFRAWLLQTLISQLSLILRAFLRLWTFLQLSRDGTFDIFSSSCVFSCFWCL